MDGWKLMGCLVVYGSNVKLVSLSDCKAYLYNISLQNESLTAVFSNKNYTYSVSVIILWLFSTEIDTM